MLPRVTEQTAAAFLEAALSSPGTAQSAALFGDDGERFRLACEAAGVRFLPPSVFDGPAV